jgi:hypothetical protein
MDADQTNRDRGRMRIPEMWRALPWRERVVCALAALLFLLAFLVGEVSDHLSVSSVGWDVVLRLDTISSLLMCASFLFFVPTVVLGMRRWSPDVWSECRRLWSLRAVLVGGSVFAAFGVWDTVTDLATPSDQIPPNPPTFLTVLAVAAMGLAFAGVLLALPEVIVRKTRAKRRQV